MLPARRKRLLAIFIVGLRRLSSKIRMKDDEEKNLGSELDSKKKNARSLSFTYKSMKSSSRIGANFETSFECRPWITNFWPVFVPKILKMDTSMRTAIPTKVRLAVNLRFFNQVSETIIHSEQPLIHSFIRYLFNSHD